MKVQERQKAILLREQGNSMGAIAEKLGVSKSSVSYWVRNVALTSEQRSRLNKNGHSIDAIEKRRIARLTNTKNRRAKILEEAKHESKILSKDPLWCVGVGLYWGEGGKTQQVVRLSNSDPHVIKTMMKFFRNSCKISEEKFRGHIHTFSHDNVKCAEAYWSSISKIPRDKFYKTYVKQSSASKRKRESLPHGTFQIYIHDTDFFYRLMGWIEFFKSSKERN